jgi:hypothetical protein
MKQVKLTKEVKVNKKVEKHHDVLVSILHRLNILQLSLFGLRNPNKKGQDVFTLAYILEQDVWEIIELLMKAMDLEDEEKAA